MNIGFYSNQLGFRGTEIAMFDYAYYNETILKNKSFIFYEKNNNNNNDDVIDKFNSHFTITALNNFNDIDEYLEKYNINILYNIKGGNYDGKISKVSKNFIHCVFTCNEPHGEIYSTISSWVSKKNNNKYPILPHIVHLPDNNDNMRKILNIPDNAIVFGRYGGSETFDIPEVHQVIYNVAINRPDIYFLFLTTDKFCPDLKNIIHLDKPIIDRNEKRKFINTCDAMIWGRRFGETFGLAIAEFSFCNKPVIATLSHVDNAHYDLLGDKGIWYRTINDLYNILLNFNKDEYKNKDLNAYRDYSPENVMKIFKELIEKLS